MGRGIRWVAGGITVLVLAVAVGWALFVPATDWVTRHDVGSARGGLAETARDNARGRLLTLGAGLFAASALVFTARNFTLSREGQVTDRYTKAIAQLGDEKADVRLGGIYALERIARDSAKDHPAVMEVLTAFVREHSRGQPSAGPGPDDAQPEPVPLSPAVDVQAALDVVGRRNAKRDIRRINLSDADLNGADLNGADLSDADLKGTHLHGTHLNGTYLRHAHLNDADLGGADLRGANLFRADLKGAPRRRAMARRADGSIWLGA